MVRVRRRHDGPRKYYNHHRDIRVSEDNPEADVSEDDAEYLVEEHGGFEYVDDPEAGEAEGADVEDAEASDEAEDDDGPPHPEEAEEVLDEADSEEVDEDDVESSDDEEPAETDHDEDGVTEESDEEDESLSFEERTALAEGLANDHWHHAVSAVEIGDADDYLDQLEQVDDRPSVQSAIEDRRTELEG